MDEIEQVESSARKNESETSLAFMRRLDKEVVVGRKASWRKRKSLKFISIVILIILLGVGGYAAYGAWILPVITLKNSTSTFKDTTIPNFKFGTNLSPTIIVKALSNGVKIYDNLDDLGTGFVRYINFDESSGSEVNDIQKAAKLQESGRDVMGNLLPRGSIFRNFDEIKRADGSLYEDYDQVILDINTYSELCTNHATKCEELKKLIKYHYFQGAVIPRLVIYKNAIKAWQTWNEPDGIATLNKIPAEALSLIATGKITYPGNRVVEFGDDNASAVINGETYTYSLKYGAGGVVYDSAKKGVIKQICLDCTVVSAGFFQTSNRGYFTILKNNNYEDSVDVNEIHLNLHPQNFMGYTRYYDQYQNSKRILDDLCGGDCGKPLWSTEAASPSDTIYKEVGFSMTFSREFQADDLIKRFVSLAGFGLTNISWNGFLNNPDAPGCENLPRQGEYYVIGSDNSLCHHQFKGLYYPNSDSTVYTQKESYSSYKTATSKLRDINSVRLLTTVETTPRVADQIFKYEITDTGANKKYAIWCDPYWNSSNITTGSWDYSAKKCANTVDLTSNGLSGAVTVTAKDGKTSVGWANSVLISQSPIFVEKYDTNVVPTAPTGVSAVAGNLQASVSFVPPPSYGGPVITKYTVKSTPGGKIVTGSASPIAVTGLEKGVAYTFTVFATNSVGEGVVSMPSNVVVPWLATIPGAPTGVSASAGRTQVSVVFVPPDNGGVSITKYTVKSMPGGKITTGSAGPIVVLGLEQAVDYTFTVFATNSVGDGPNSVSSAPAVRLTATVISTLNDKGLLPEPMVGQTTVMINPGETDQTVFYDGMGSNQVILTTDPDANLVEYNRTMIEACRGVLALPNLVKCFSISGGSGSPIKNMVSRSLRDGMSGLEISALLYDPSIIQGDAYGMFDSDNFAFYGRNLNQTSNGAGPSNGSWNVTNYSLNPEAQSSFDKDQLAYMKNRVMKLAGEAQTVPAITLRGIRDWYLQGSTIGSVSNDEADKYPEGKVWLVNDYMALDRNITYHGKGTIIFLNNPGSTLEIGLGHSILPGNPDTDSLGLIIGGNPGGAINDVGGVLDFQGNNKLTAAVLVFGMIAKGGGTGSVEATGSFVANEFKSFANNGFSHFTYDYKLDQMWPPGFRYFNMPTSKNGSAN